MMKGLGHLTYKERLRARSIQPGEEKAQGDLINVYKPLMGGFKEDGDRPFSVMFSGRTRGDQHIPKHRKFHLNVRKHCFTVRVVKH